MKLLFDECVPRKVKFLLADGGHECETVRDSCEDDAEAFTTA
jgi:predicted nuclease of predicted toxin-antitoxin system